MRIEDFSQDQQRFLVKTAKGALAFVPPALPPKLNLAELALPLGAAAAAAGELKGAARRFANPYMLIRPLIQKEALTSSAIEGTMTTIEGIVVEQAAPGAKPDENAREAANYVAAVQSAFRQLEKLPLSHRVIKDAHRILLSGLSPARGQGKRPGEYKDSQNAVGQTGDNEFRARYVPPPPETALRCMDALEKFFNRDDRRAMN
jgi:Fic family protein